jgi:hypothetical protein
MTRRQVLVCAILLGLSVLCVPPVSAKVGKPSPSQEGPVMPTQPVIPTEWLPDLVVTSVTVAATCEASGTVKATINAIVKNQSPKGIADLSKIPWQIILAADWWPTGGPATVGQSAVKPVLPQAGGPMSLKPGQWVARTLTITGIPKHKPGAAGGGTHQFGFKVTADPTKGVAEADEKNNEKSAFAPDPCTKP